jgi:hypothetical protein
MRVSLHIDFLTTISSRPHTGALMRVLFDQGTPVPIRRFQTIHSVRTAAEQEWTTLENGQLLDAAEASGFDVLLTTDKNIRHQQNLADRRTATSCLGSRVGPCFAITCSASSRPSMRQLLGATPRLKSSHVLTIDSLLRGI